MSACENIPRTRGGIIAPNAYIGGMLDCAPLGDI
jgi:hypothetical protein